MPDSVMATLMPATGTGYAVGAGVIDGDTAGGLTVRLESAEKLTMRHPKQKNTKKGKDPYFARVSQ